MSRTPCPNCRNDRAVYGFTLEDGGIYMTKVKEVKVCCAVKVRLISHTASEVTFEVEGKDGVYKKTRKDFMTSSWRDHSSQWEG